MTATGRLIQLASEIAWRQAEFARLKQAVRAVARSHRRRERHPRKLQGTMKTITLEEALKGATKGPFKTCTCGKCGLMWSGDGSFNVATVHKEWGDDPEHPDGTMTEEMRQHNLTLLAHCFN